MNQSEREKMSARRVIHPATYHVRHDNGDTFEVQALTLARVRKLIEAECQDRGWLMTDIDWFEVEEKK